MPGPHGKAGGRGDDLLPGGAVAGGPDFAAIDVARTLPAEDEHASTLHCAGMPAAGRKAGVRGGLGPQHAVGRGEHVVEITAGILAADHPKPVVVNHAGMFSAAQKSRGAGLERPGHSVGGGPDIAVVANIKAPDHPHLPQKSGAGGAGAGRKSGGRGGQGPILAVGRGPDILQLRAIIAADDPDLAVVDRAAMPETRGERRGAGDRVPDPAVIGGPNVVHQSRRQAGVTADDPDQVIEHHAGMAGAGAENGVGSRERPGLGKHRGSGIGAGFKTGRLGVAGVVALSVLQEKRQGTQRGGDQKQAEDPKNCGKPTLQNEVLQNESHDFDSNQARFQGWLFVGDAQRTQ